MKKAGLKTIRIAEFSWALLEPEEGVYDFTSLDSAISTFSSFDFQIIIGTPTACPPAWSTLKYPQSLRRDEAGIKMKPQSRRHADCNNNDYNRLCMNITKELAKRYGKHLNVYGWQIDNEYGCHNTVRSTSIDSDIKFREWLKIRYDNDLNLLNEKWGSVFWSQSYNEWGEILCPTSEIPAAHSPSLVIDFKRFSSDSWLKFNLDQRTILRKFCKPESQITHNMMLYYFDYDMPKLAEQLDFVSWDNYETYGAHPIAVAANHDWMFGAGDKPFWVMEQQLGQVNWGVYGQQ